MLDHLQGPFVGTCKCRIIMHEQAKLVSSSSPNSTGTVDVNLLENSSKIIMCTRTGTIVHCSPKVCYDAIVLEKEELLVMSSKTTVGDI